MHELKTGICYFLDSYGKGLSLTRFANDPFSKTQVPSREFEKDDNLRIWVKRNVELFS